MFCETLSTKANEREILDKVDRFFEAHCIRWEHVIGGYVDGAPAMLGYRFGLVKEKSPDVIGTHCTFHCQALILKTMLDDFKSVLNNLIKALNLIEANALNSRLFADLCKGSNYEFKTPFFAFAFEIAFKRKGTEESFCFTKRNTRISV